MPHAEHVEQSDEMAKRGRDDVVDFEDVNGTPCCPPPVLFIDQQAKLSGNFNGIKHTSDASHNTSQNMEIQACRL